MLGTLFRHNGVIREFASGEAIVEEIADLFSLNGDQRSATLERIYHKENRIVRTPLWHRLLYRAADSLAKEKLVTRPTDTARLTNKREWMLTEEGFDEALRLLNIPIEQKDTLAVKSFEVQKEVKKITASPPPDNYNPFESARKTRIVTQKSGIRARSFRQAVIESYGCKCCVCGLQMKSPDLLCWEVQAAHIVPHNLSGKDDVWNGVALCHLHHWAFDVGWFSFSDDYRILVSSRSRSFSDDFMKIQQNDFFWNGLVQNKTMTLPENNSLCPHKNSIEWHRQHIFYQ